MSANGSAIEPHDVKEAASTSENDWLTISILWKSWYMLPFNTFNNSSDSFVALPAAVDIAVASKERPTCNLWYRLAGNVVELPDKASAVLSGTDLNIISFFLILSLLVYISLTSPFVSVRIAAAPLQHLLRLRNVSKPCTVVATMQIPEINATRIIVKSKAVDVLVIVGCSNGSVSTGVFDRKKEKNNNNVVRICSLEIWKWTINGKMLNLPKWMFRFWL